MAIPVASLSSSKMQAVMVATLEREREREREREAGLAMAIDTRWTREV